MLRLKTKYSDAWPRTPKEELDPHPSAASSDDPEAEPKKNRRRGIPESIKSLKSACEMSNLALMLANRDARHPLGALGASGNRIVWIILIGSLSLLGAVQNVPYLREMFQISPLGWQQWGVSVALAAICLAVCPWLQSRS